MRPSFGSGLEKDASPVSWVLGHLILVCGCQFTGAGCLHDLCGLAQDIGFQTLRYRLRILTWQASKLFNSKLLIRGKF